MEQYDLEPGQGFEEVNADAVCEQCDTVNEEGTLLCKACGNNLRDQRSHRIAAGAGPDLIDAKQNRIQLLTGLLVVLGILLVFYAVWNIDSLERLMVQALSEERTPLDEDPWTGPDSVIYERLLQDITEFPTPFAVQRDALLNPQVETNYNGRYLVIRPGRLNPERVIGEAQLNRLGEKVYFVFLSNEGNVEVRGYAAFEAVDDAERATPVVRETAEIRIDGNSYVGMGLATPIARGGHSLFTMRGDSDNQWDLLAYRVP